LSHSSAYTAAEIGPTSKEILVKRGLLLVLACAPLLGAPAQASTADGFGLERVHGSVNYVSDETFGIDMGAEIAAPFEGFSLTSELTWWSQSQDLPGGDISFRDIGLLAGVRHHFPAEERLRPYADAGLGIHLMKLENDGNNSSTTDTKLGLYLGAGVAYYWNRQLQFYGQLRAHLTEPDFSTLSLGASYRLGR
jgi:opacity protein-like surface antigen